MALQHRSQEPSPAWSRSAILAYGVVAYAIGLAALVWFMAFSLDVIGIGQGPLRTGSLIGAVVVNLVLIALFGVQHSVMARPWFKKRITAWIPAACERSTYVLASGVVLGATLWLWQPLPGTVFSIESAFVRGMLRAVSAAGWIYLVAASFATSHVDLFGLRQVAMHFCDRPYEPIPFSRRFMYNYSRHPIMTGLLFGIWATPDLSLSQLMMNVGITTYILIGVHYEERDLIRHFGAVYEEYKRNVPALLPLPKFLLPRPPARPAPRH